MPFELVKWNDAKRAVAEAKTVDELKGIRDKAEALRAYAKQVGESLTVQNDICEIKLRAERRMGEMLQETELHPGGRPTENPSYDDRGFPKLDDIGITWSQSSRYQSIANLSLQEFEDHITEVKEAERELTEAGLISFVKETFRTENIAAQRETIRKNILTMPDGEFDIIVIDPPWPYGNVDDYQPDHYLTRVASPYPEMTLEDIENIQLPADENCVLWLWTTHKFLPEAYNIMQTWGFNYKATMVWNKISMGVGVWLRKQCEFCLLGTKGTPAWLANDVRDIIEEARTSHSVKPEAFYQLVEKCSEGRKLDYFARKPRAGWASYGLIEKTSEVLQNVQN